nr:MAG: phytoene dehydrogenase [Bacteroidota bacterium]
MKQVIIIGAGFGGLALGIRLQSRGIRTLILDKQPQPGGHAGQLRLRGYTFDMGPSLITAPELLDELFALAGVRREERLPLRALDPYYRIMFHDGSRLDYTGDTERMREQLARLSPEDARNYEPFMEHARAFYEAVILDGLGARPFGWRELFEFLPRALRLGALGSAYSLAARYFRDERVRFTFSFHPLFIGGNPFRAPAVYQMIPYLEKVGGVWYAPGGMHAVVQALARLFAELGGQLLLGLEVEEILVRHRRAVGVRAGGEVFAADAVVSNADFLHTYGQLIAPEHRRHWSSKRLRRVRYSMSAVLLYLGVRRQYPEQLLHHTIALSPRYRGLVEDIFERKVLPEDFSLYLHTPSRTDPSMAPEGSESLYALVPVPNLQSGIDWDREAPRFAERVLAFLEERLGLEGLRTHLEVMELFTPLDFLRRRNCTYGAAWGVEPVLWQTAVLRPRNRSEDIERLYLVGASTHPGAGVPGVLLGAKATEQALLQDLGIAVHTEPLPVS